MQSALNSLSLFPSNGRLKISCDTAAKILAWCKKLTLSVFPFAGIRVVVVFDAQKSGLHSHSEGDK